ncbi:hypothetical protein QJS10_CPA01g00687 [Acorus calamus]|uniref:NAD(P)-binding protein n=1 Tax=Acorus calamus TaxID=4465 RepID=A0AAV9FQR7_ACOCL|nr:hypothetical protein QJS10_CPA01g00687 [Acorus calamus]
MVRQLLEKNDKGHVVATCRNPDKAVGLVELKRKYTERLNVLQLDITNESTIEASANSIREKYGSLNLLINASGVLSIPDVLQPETTLSKVQKSALLLTYEINAVGPILVIKHMWPLLKVGGGSGTDREFSVVANLSARVGSIGDNGLGGWHSYRSSKTALNQYIEFFGTNIFPIHAVTKTIAVEFTRKKDPIVCILLHPGTVDTDLSRPFQRNVPQVGVQGHWEPHRDLAEPGDLTEKPILHPWQGFDTALHTLAHGPTVRDGGQALSELVKAKQETDFIVTSPQLTMASEASKRAAVVMRTVRRRETVVVVVAFIVRGLYGCLSGDARSGVCASMAVCGIWILNEASGSMKK